MIKVFDFFSGCGGTSCGFKSAGLDIVFGLDNDQDAANTFGKNFPNATVHCGDIAELRAETLSSLIKSGDTLLFCGCAPCQPFSKQNRLSRENDPRRSLLGEFARFVRHWLPAYVFVENVPGMQRIGSKDSPFLRFKAELERLGYVVTSAVLPAMWYGVPQTRERLVLLASRAPGISLPKATHGPGLRAPSTVRQWIGKMQPLRAGQKSSKDEEHCTLALSEINLERIRATPEGGGRESWPRRLLLSCHDGHKGHSDVYGRLSWDKPASAITTRCISYSNGRFGHPTQPRAISVREAARLQTFPKNYKFSGSMTSKARQIGNAVPPLMARKVGDSVIAHFEWTKSIQARD